jgi:hypothetical protein
MEIALISCTKLKQDYICQAQKMYLPSALFRKASTYIRNNYDVWFILSAKYGLLKPEEIIEPYNITLNKFSKKELVAWSEKIYLEMARYPITAIDFYAGEKYRSELIPMLEKNNVRCKVPLRGLGIGQQLHFYNERLN